MSTIRYICQGSCGQKIAVESYKKGQKKCNDRSCDSFGSALECGEYCAQCNTNFDEGEDHFCI